MSHLKDGVPAPPQWKQVLEIHEQQQVTQAGEDVPEFGNAEGAYQKYILEKLGHIRYDCSGEEFGVHHEVRICGDIVKIPVMMLEIPEGTQDLISEASLQELMKTPAQRRAEKVMERNKGKSDYRRSRARKALGRGIRMKCALGKFSDVVLEQIDVQLKKFTRHEVFGQLQFLAGGKKVKGVKKAASLKGKPLKGVSWKLLKQKITRKDLKDKIS